MDRIPQNAVTLAAYLAGVATILVLQTIQPETKVVVMPGTANILARPPVTSEMQQVPSFPPIQEVQPTQAEAEITTVRTCQQDTDCASPTAICAIRYGVCEELRDPECSCSQSQVLRCTDAAKRSKHTFCTGGCVEMGSSARCL